MKYRRSIVAFMAILFIFLLSGNIFVLADDKPTFGINEIIDTDSNVTTVVSFTPGKAAAGSIKIGYNTDILELISVKEGAANAQVININSKNKGEISINFLNSSGVVKGNTELAIIEFNLKFDRLSSNDVYAKSFELYDINSKLISDNTTTDLRYSINSQNMSPEYSEEPDNESSKQTSQSGTENSKTDNDPSRSESGGVTEDDSSADHSNAENSGTTGPTPGGTDGNVSGGSDISTGNDTQNPRNPGNTAQTQDGTEGSATAYDISESTEGSVTEQDPKVDTYDESGSEDAEVYTDDRQQKIIIVIVISAITVVVVGILYFFISRWIDKDDESEDDSDDKSDGGSDEEPTEKN